MSHPLHFLILLPLILSPFTQGGSVYNLVSMESLRPVITRLPSSVYSALRAEYKSLMSAYPAAPRRKLLDTCYNLTGHENAAVPKMVLHFKGADVALDSSGVIWWEEGSQVMCLAFAATTNDGDVNIIGNNQQKTLGILYHIPQNKLEFRTHACCSPSV